MSENDPEILPGWTMRYEEVSNDVYHVTFTDSAGRKASTTKADFDEAVKTCLEFAFEIEKQVCSNWGKFLYDTGKLRLSGKKISEDIYHSEHFGSWILGHEGKRMVYDGKEGWLLLQAREENLWVNREIIADILGISVAKLLQLIKEVRS